MTKKIHHFKIFFFLVFQSLCWNFFFHRENVGRDKEFNWPHVMSFSCSVEHCFRLFLFLVVFSFIYLFILVSLESTFVFITSSSLANCKLYVSVYYI